VARFQARPGGGMFLKRGGGKFLKNSAATGGMIQKNDKEIFVNAGVSERVAMEITGHRTWSVFDRYRIVSPGDLREAARKLAGTFWGTPPGSVVDCGSLNS